MSLLGGRLCEVAYTNPLLPPPFFLINSNQGGHGPLYSLAMPVPVVQPGFVNLGSNRGSEATERRGGGGGGWEVGFPSQVREISLIIRVLKRHFLTH